MKHLIETEHFYVEHTFWNPGFPYGVKAKESVPFHLTPSLAFCDSLIGASREMDKAEVVYSELLVNSLRKSA